MRIAIVTAYCDEPLSVISRCVDSVRNQTIPCTHILVSDRGGTKLDCVASMQHIQLSIRHADFGNTPRLIGSASACAQGFDGLCWLDADNWLESHHLESMLARMMEAGCQVVTSRRRLRRSDGSVLGECTQSDGVSFCDTNCYLLGRDAMTLSVAWGFQYQRGIPSALGDRAVWDVISARFPARAHNLLPTVNYTTTFASHYLERGEMPPNDAKIFVESASGDIITQPYHKFRARQQTSLGFDSAPHTNPHIGGAN